MLNPMPCLVLDESKVEGGMADNVKEAGLVNQAVCDLLFWPARAHYHISTLIERISQEIECTWTK